MTTAFVPCSSCDRHARADETACPFCQAPLADRARASGPRRVGRLTRAALFAGAAALATACGGGAAEEEEEVQQDTSGDEALPADEGGDEALPTDDGSGEPVDDGQADGGGEDDRGGPVAMYGGPPADGLI